MNDIGSVTATHEYSVSTEVIAARRRTNRRECGTGRTEWGSRSTLRGQRAG